MRRSPSSWNGSATTPDGGLVIFEDNGTPWRFLQPDHDIQEHTPDAVSAEID